MNWLKKKLLGLAQVARDAEKNGSSPRPALPEAGHRPALPQMPAERLGRMKALPLQPYFTISGKPHVRVTFGDEKDFTEAEQGKVCRGCGTRPGDLHVPSCPREECPSCAGTAFLCDCKYGNG